MCSLEQLKIDLKGLQETSMVLEYDLGDDYFSALDGSQLEHGALHVSVSIRKMTGFFDLQFHTEGVVTVSCDRTIDENEGILDLSWFIYEFTMLAIPIKHVHAPGKCNSAMTQKLNELSGAVRSGEEETETPIDPRWEALSKLNIKD